MVFIVTGYVIAAAVAASITRNNCIITIIISSIIVIIILIVISLVFICITIGIIIVVKDAWNSRVAELPSKGKASQRRSLRKTLGFGV